MTNLSYAQIEQRRAAARSRWEKAGAVIGTGLLFGFGAHGASYLIRRKIANTVSERLASKIGAVNAQVSASKDRQLKAINDKESNHVKTVEDWLQHYKKISRSTPKKVRDTRIQDINTLRNAYRKHLGNTVFETGTPQEEIEQQLFERRPFQNPVTHSTEYVSTAEALDHINKGLEEQSHLEQAVLPGRVYRKANMAKPPNQPDAPKVVARKASRPKQTRGRMSKEKIAELRRLVYLPRDIAAAKSIVMARAKALEERKKLKDDYANTSQQMENIHARLRAYYARRGYTQRKAAVVTGASVLGGGVVGYNLSNLQKAAPNDPSFADKIQQVFESLKTQTQEMIYNVANGLSPFDLKLVQDKLRLALEPLTDYFLKGVAEGIASERPKYVNVRFDLLQPVIFSHLDGSRTQLIVNLSEEQRNNITKAITEGLAAGHAPAKIALTIRPGIGLTENQAQFVANYKNDLVLNNSNALARALRDKRYDRTVAKAIKTGVPLTQDQINKLTDAYGRKFLAFRANTIARDQSLAAVNLGHVSTIKEVASKHGLMVEKTWIATHDSRTREAHRELDGKTVIGVDTPFQSELGPIRYPYDPQASAADTIQCRCHMKFKLMPMNQITDVSQ